jgi:hypothetical protein
MLQQIKKKGRKTLHKVLNNRFAQRAIVSCSTMVFCVSEAMATSKGAGGFTKATTEISSYQTPVSNLMKAIAAVIVLVGAFNVYFKMQNGDQDVKKNHHAHHRRLRGFLLPCPRALPLFFK